MPSCHRSPAARRRACSARRACVAGQAHGLVEGLLVVARVVGRAHDRAHRLGEGGQQVAPAQLDRIDLQLGGGQVHHPLQELGRLGPAGPPEGAHRRGVGHRHGHVVADSGNAVHPLRHHAGRAHGQGAAEAGVGAGVAQHPAVHAGDAAVGVEAHLDPLHLAPAVGHGHQVLGAVLHPGEGPSERPGGGDDGGVLVPHPGLAAEGPAHMRGDHPQTGGVEAEGPADRGGEAVGHLGGHVDRQVVAPAVVAGNDGDRVAFHRHHRDPLVLQRGPHHGGRPGERVGVAAVAGDQVGADLLELQRGAVGHGLLRVGHRGQGLVVDVDQLGGIDGGGLGLGHDHGHRLSDEADLALRQRRPGAGRVQDHEPVEGRHAEVGRRVDGQDPGRRWPRGVDLHDPGVGHGRADEGHPRQAIDAEVADVGAAPCQQVGVFDAADASTEKRAGHARNLP